MAHLFSLTHPRPDSESPGDQAWSCYKSQRLQSGLPRVRRSGDVGTPGGPITSRRNAMQRSYRLMSWFAAGLVVTAGIWMPQPAQAQFGGSPAEIAQQLELEKTYPKLQITDDFLGLTIPGYTMGQSVGVSTDSSGDLFVYSRSNPQGIARGGKAAMLWEFGPAPDYKFIKEWGPNNYAESFAHAVRVDSQNNVWIVDEGSGMVVKFNPEGVSTE